MDVTLTLVVKYNQSVSMGDADMGGMPDSQTALSDKRRVEERTVSHLQLFNVLVVTCGLFLKQTLLNSNTLNNV